MSIPTFTLRAYQDLNISHICRALLRDTKQHVLFAGPMASGKTLIGKALAARLLGTRFTTILLLGPSTNIVERWREPVKVRNVESNWVERVYGSQAARDGKLETDPLLSKSKTPRLLRSEALHNGGSFWQNEVEGIFAATRQAICDAQVIAMLDAAKKSGAFDLAHMLVIVDEGHHHHERNLSGQFCQSVMALGGTVVLLTGTPWHRNGVLTTEDSAEIVFTNSKYAKETDDKGRPLAPREWRVEHERVEECETDDLSLVVDDGNEAKSDLDDAKRKIMIKRIVARFVADGCPKVVINVPRVDPWVVELLGVLKRSTKVRAVLKSQGRPALRAVDFTGADKQRIEDIETVMSAEAKVKRYADSKIDVVVACARMNEGTDWPLCSHVYNVRIPGSLSLILQRWSRASRSKLGFEGYPIAHAEAQTLVFFSPTIVDEVKAEYWAKHRNIALAMAALLEDYRVALKYVNVCPEGERYKKALKDGKMTDKIRDGALDSDDHDQAWEGKEKNRAEAMATLIEVIEKRGGEMSIPDLAAFIKAKAKGDKELEAELTQAAIIRLEGVNPEVAELVRKKRSQSRARFGGGRDYGTELIRRDMQVAWDEVVETYPNVMFSTPADLNQGSLFTPMGLPDLVEMLRECGEFLYLGETQEEAESLAREHGLLHKSTAGEWPSKRSGRCLSLPSKPMWDSIDAALRRKYNSSLATAFGALSKPERNAQAIVAFYHSSGRWPRQVGGLEEKRLGHALSALRTSYHALCAQYSIPLRAFSKDHWDKVAQEVSAYFSAHGRWPRKAPTDAQEKRLGVALGNLRQGHPEICARYQIPLQTDRADAIRYGMGSRQFLLLAEVTARLGRAFPATHRASDIEGDSGFALNHALVNAHSKPSASRGLGYAPDLCQVNSIARANTEVTNDCWRFTLRGAKNPDRRKWADLLASGDNKKIESAERVAFLDWENPDAAGKPVRRPWSPPATTAKAS